MFPCRSFRQAGGVKPFAPLGRKELTRTRRPECDIGGDVTLAPRRASLAVSTHSLPPRLNTEEKREHRILVTGATGTIGRPLIDLLVGEGTKVRAVTRDPLAAGLPADVEVVEGDPSRPDTIAPSWRASPPCSSTRAPSGSPPSNCSRSPRSGASSEW
jgi:hypothetical protein